MPINYKAIKKENKKEYGRIHRWGPGLLDKLLYSDQTHFIYELLQNVEDAEASEVKFRLYKDRLELEHNGRPFNEADVRSICRLAEGTKADDLTKIGKFGMGFKSVYAHTSSPEIHSVDEHFAVDNYVHPRSVFPQFSAMGTLFVFPFNHREKEPDKSFSAISRRLKELGTSTLLFLKHIKSISYEIGEEATGSYRRETEPVQESDFVSDVTVIGQSNLRAEKERWLVFERDVTHHLIQQGYPIPEGGKLTVEIAFLYSNNDSQNTPKFECLPQSHLAVFFPTREKTDLGFLVQGPYKTTLSRESVPEDDDFNISLSEQTGDLVVKALRWLHARDWLTVDVLTTMPLKPYGRFDTLFAPIYDKVLTAIRDEDLIPAYKGGYVSGKNAKLAGSEPLRALLSNTQLQQFCNTEAQLCWISDEITEQRRTSALRHYLIHYLDIAEIDNDDFARNIEKGFIACQSDNWVREFYEFAPRGIHYILRNKPIIRLQDGSHVVPFARDGKPQAYLPTEHSSRFFATIETEVCNSEKSLTFLRNLGLKEPDIVDEVKERILPEYRNCNKVDDAEHRQDIETIVKALRRILLLPEWSRKRTELIEDLKKTPFLLATNATNDVNEFCCPDKIYLQSQELEMYFEGNPDVWFLSSEYKSYVDDFEQIGVTSQVRVSRIKPDNKGHVSLPYWRNHRRGKDGFDPDCSICGLEFALTQRNTERAKYIWESLLLRPSYQRCILGTVEYGSRQDFSPSGKIHYTEEQVSIMGELVRERAWLPNKEGEFVVPSEITLDELSDDFSKDEQLATRLGMKVSYQTYLDNAPEEIKQRLKKAEKWEELERKYPEVLDIKELDEFLRRKAAKTGGDPPNGDDTPKPPNGGTSPVPPDNPGGEPETPRHVIADIAMKAVMQAEIALGNDPRDVSSSRGLGYDIESRTPEGVRRFIEVKGRSASAGNVTLTRNELCFASNNPQQFILAVVEVEDSRAQPPRYLCGYRFYEPDPLADSISFNLRKLLQHCQEPS